MSGSGSVPSSSSMELCRDESHVRDARHQDLHQAHDARGVTTTDRAHLDDLAVDKLHPVILAQDAGLGHAVIVVDVEQPFTRFDLHASHDTP